jgi:hypothetical protein
MRENRLSGSEGGGTANPALPTPIQGGLRPQNVQTPGADPRVGPLEFLHFSCGCGLGETTVADLDIEMFD